MAKRLRMGILTVALHVNDDERSDLWTEGCVMRPVVWTGSDLPTVHLSAHCFLTAEDRYLILY